MSQDDRTVTEPITHDPAMGQLQGGAPGFFGGYSIRGFVVECPAPEWWETPDISVHWELTGPDSRGATEDTSPGSNAGESTMDIDDIPGPMGGAVGYLSYDSVAEFESTEAFFEVNGS